MTTPKAAARAAQILDCLPLVARIGYVVLGILHIVIGVIAISFVTGGRRRGRPGRRDGADPEGARWACCCSGSSCSASSRWRSGRSPRRSSSAIPTRRRSGATALKYIGTAVAYIAIAFTALVYALGGQSDSSESSQTFSAQLMSTPGGRLAAGPRSACSSPAIGIAFVVRGITRAFKKHLDLPPDPAGKGIVTFGVVGYVAKGIAIGVTGVLFVVAAFTHDPETAGGLDAALHTLAGLPFGPVILWIVGGRTDHLRPLLLRSRALRQDVIPRRSQHRRRTLNTEIRRPAGAPGGAGRRVQAPATAGSRSSCLEEPVA